VRPTRPGERAGSPLRPSPLARRGDVPYGSRAEQRAAEREMRREQKLARKELKNNDPLPMTGEPLVVVRARRDFARWVSVTGGCFLVNLATGMHSPWFLFPAFAMSFGLFGSYSRLWQSGYSWRDVLHRPDAPDSIGSGNKTPKIKGIKQITEPTTAEFGAYHARMLQVYKDRSVILSLMNQLSQADRDMLPDIVETTEGLYARASQLAGTLGTMDGLGLDDTPRLELRIAELKQRPEGEERDRQISLLQQQLLHSKELTAQRGQFADRFESCVLAMQNVRLDLMRLKQSGVGAVLSGLTMATQQARALSRDVDNAIGAAAEVKAL
jgi:hypothetical protein